MFWGLGGGGGGGGGGRGVHYIKKKNRKIKQIDCIIPEALDQVYQFINETLLGVFRIPDNWVAIERIAKFRGNIDRVEHV